MRPETVEVVVVNIDDRLRVALGESVYISKVLREHPPNDVALLPHGVRAPGCSLSGILDPDAMKPISEQWLLCVFSFLLHALGEVRENVDLSLRPLCERGVGKLFGKDPRRHGHAMGLQEFPGAGVLRRIPGLIIKKIPRVEIVRVPGNRDGDVISCSWGMR